MSLFAVAKVWVRDIATQSPIQKANVNVYVGGNLFQSGITDSSGFIQFNVLVQEYVFAASHPNYLDNSVIAQMTQDETATIFILLERNPNPEPKREFKIYCVENRNYRVSGTKIRIGNEDRSTNKDGLAIFHLLDGPKTIEFLNSGVIYLSPLQTQDILFTPFTADINLIGNTTITALLEQGRYYIGDPPSPPGGDGWGAGIGAIIFIIILVILAISFLRAPRVTVVTGKK